MSKGTIYYVGEYHREEAAIFADLFYDIQCIPSSTGTTSLFRQMTRKDCIVLGGGGDISPSLYGETLSRFSSASQGLSNRDSFENYICDIAFEYAIPVLGICRGAQFLAAYTGNKLVQHVTGHNQNHPISFTDPGKILLEDSGIDVNAEYPCLSSHHQMVTPHHNDEIEVLMTSPRQSSVFVFSDDVVIETANLPPTSSKEIEIFVGTNHNFLGIQGHPEYGYIGHAFTDLSRNLLTHYRNLWSN